VTIPARIDDGGVLRVDGKGMPSPAVGGEAGDLSLVVQTQPDPRFERVGTDLLRQQAPTTESSPLGNIASILCAWLLTPPQDVVERLGFAHGFGEVVALAELAAHLQ